MGRRIVRAPERPTRGDIVVAPYFDRLKNLIPAEVSAVYVAGSGIVPSTVPAALGVWAAFCLFCTAWFMARQSRTTVANPVEKHPVDRNQVAIASVSFVVWVYALGGPFAAFGLHVPWLGTLIMLGWTFIIPQLYKGTTA